MVKIQVNSQGKAYLTTGGKALVAPEGGSKYGATVNSLLGDVDANGVLQLPTEQSDLVFTGVKDVAANGLAYKYYYNTNLTGIASFPDLEEISGTDACYSIFQHTGITSVSMQKLATLSGGNSLYTAFSTSHLNSLSLPELTTVSGNNAMRNMCGSSRLTSFSAPKLKTVSGTYALYGLFSVCTLLTSVDLSGLETADVNNAMGNLCGSCYALPEIRFTKLNSVNGGSVLAYAFTSCRAITDIYFNALTTTSFGSYINQFSRMFDSDTASTSGNVNVHFPSNLQSTISGLTGYPLFGGTSGRITLLFDLPATS